VGEIGGDTGCVDNIEQGKLVHQRRDLQQERQWLRGFPLVSRNARSSR